MTLTEFLEDRIAEDEARLADDRPVAFLDSLVGRELARRLLDECEAKRRIVENWRLYSEAQFPDYEGGYLSAMDDVLKLLALPYADHPDYREEWKP